MPTLEVGDVNRELKIFRRHEGSVRSRQHGFTLLEILLVVAIIAIASAGVSFAVRDAGQTALEREADRLAALLESARARSQASGAPVRWRSTDGGFVFDGLPADLLPEGWASKQVGVAQAQTLLLGPEPIIGAQTVRLVTQGTPVRELLVRTDGIRPFKVEAPDTAGPR